MKKELTPAIKNLTKSSVWDIQENDVYRLWKDAEKDADLKDNKRHYLDVINSAFELEEITNDNPLMVKKYEERGFRVGKLKGIGAEEAMWAIKKRDISRVSDLTYENIRHISASKLLEVINRNFGGGWDSLSQSIKDIILSGFEISTTTLPKDRLHNPGGIYEKKEADNFEILEIPKGNWVEVIFAKEKPEMVPARAEEPVSRPKRSDMDFDNEDDADDEMDSEMDERRDEEDEFDEEDVFDEDALDQESYRTEFDTGEGDLTLDDVTAAEDEY